MRQTLLAWSAIGTLLAAGPSADPPALDLTGRVTDHAPFRAREDNEDEFRAYCQALIAADQTTVGEFAPHARRDVTYAHLFEEPDKFRGQVIHLEGRLTRVRRFDAPEFVRQTYDLPYLYEGWLFDPEVYGINSTCVVFTELPSGFEVVENTNRPVSFDGYFFKRYRYRGADGTLREAPLLIGHAPVNRRSGENTAAHPGITLPQWLLGAFLGLVGGTAVLAVALTWWYRHGDRRVRSLLHGAPAAPWLDSGDEADDRPRISGSADAGTFPPT
jgi:hypothetical protein